MAADASGVGASQHATLCDAVLCVSLVMIGVGGRFGG